MNSLRASVERFAPKIGAVSSVALSLFAVSLTVRFVFLILVSQNYTAESIMTVFPDSGVYLEIAEYFHTSAPKLAEQLLISGPGYGFILYLLNGILGLNSFAFLSVQIIVSAISSLLVRELALRLNLSHPVATLAGYVHALSLSAIYLSCSILTETWFIFFTLLGLIFFLKALKSHKLPHYLAFALLVFAATMTRSIGQFFPLALGFLIIVCAIRTRNYTQRSLGRPLLFIALSLTLIFSWSMRNYLKHDIFTVSETGTRAARVYLIASSITGNQDYKQVKEIRALWEKEFRERFPDSSFTLKDKHDFDLSVIRDSMSKYPSNVFRAYRLALWDNITTECNLQRLLIPQLNTLWGPLSRVLLSGAGPFIVLLSLLGLAGMALCGKSEAALFLGLFYLLFAMTSGVTFWQGSRVFFRPYRSGLSAVLSP